ncbi:hypothetical protein [Agromyces sp. ZXT2-3]|uniref:hypothetical protein n=1 Tax=Agromyces sp. ZXT2-3 TaxID=3461152 RepID=UPI004054A07F
MTEPEPGTTAARLWGLLPAVYRLRDAETGGVLAELLDVFGDQLDVLAEELAQLYDDQFVETAAPWAAPYLGELVGYRVIHGVAPEVASPRAEVANTVAYRRRKGTAAVVEQLARDVTGWPARVVESFERLATTQYAGHVRPHALATPDLRDHEAVRWVATMGGGFDDLAHTGDVLPIAADGRRRRGRHGIRKVPVFLWRTEAVPVDRSPLVPHSADGRRFRFDPLGTDMQLFALPRIESELEHLAEPPDVPRPLGRRWAAEHVAAVYGASTARARRSVRIDRLSPGGEPEPVPVAEVRIADLADLPGGGGAWAHEPDPGTVAIDPVLGRVFLGDAVAAGDRLLGSFALGMAVPVGAGNTRPGGDPAPQPATDASGGETLQPLLDAASTGGTVRIVDSDRYAGALTLTTVAGPAEDPEVEVRLAAGEHERPTLVVDEVRLEMEPATRVVLDGLLVAGGAVVLDEAVDAPGRREIVIRDSTLVPGHTRTTDGRPAEPTRASLVVLDPRAVVRIERSVVGPVVAVEGSIVEVVDSIVDASTRTAVAIAGRGGPSPRTVTGPSDLEVGDGTVAAGDLDLRESTVVGGIRCLRLDASNCLLVAALAPGDPRPNAIHAERRQAGCVRYSYLPEASRTGRRFHCAPDPDDPAGVRLATRPRFTSMRYGDPAYLRLHEGTPDRIRLGADDESEMGATHRLYSPQRESNLRIRLDEYLRFGLAADRFFAT